MPFQPNHDLISWRLHLRAAPAIVHGRKCITGSRNFQTPSEYFMRPRSASLRDERSLRQSGS